MKKISLVMIFLLLPTSLRVFSREAPIKRVTHTRTLHSKSKALTNSKKLMQKEEVAQLIADTGFPTKVVPIVTCLAEHESNFKTKAVNKNRNLTHDYGLLQINDVWLKGCKTTPKKLANPVENAKCALKIYKTQGLTAWSTYKKFKNTCLAYQVHFVKYEDIADAEIPNKNEIKELM